jgi:hypothetical protein
VDVIRRAVGFAVAVLVRALAAIGGAVTAYGAAGMFSTAGIMPPNAIVLIGLGLCAVMIPMLWSSEHRLSGIWPALLLVGLPFALYALGSWSTAECAPDHPPITPTFSCSPVGTHGIAVVAPVITLLALVLLVRDVRATMPLSSIRSRPS